MSEEAIWARVGYAAWNDSRAGKPARVHLVIPARNTDGRWGTACGMVYSDREVRDAEPHDDRCK